MSKNKVVHFEIPASDFKKAKEFYEKVFDWKVELWGDKGAMAYTTKVDKDQKSIEPGGINGGFYKRQCPLPLGDGSLFAIPLSLLIHFFTLRELKK